MKLLVLAHSYPRFAGDSCGPFVEDLCEAHAAAGHEVRVLLPFDPALAEQRDGRRVHVVPYRYAPFAAWHRLGYSRTLKADVGFRPLVWPLAPAMLAAGTLAAWREVRRWQPDVIHAHWLLPNGFMAAPAARRSGIPLFITLHGSDVFVAERNAAFRAMARLALRVARGVTSCSPELADRLIALGAAPQRIHLVPNGSDPARFAGAAQPAGGYERWPTATPAGQRILALGRFVHKKGFDVLVQAMVEVVRTHPGAHCHIAGGGDLEAALLRQIGTLGLEDNVSLGGPVSQTDVPALLAACDVFVMPSVRDAAGNIDGLPVVVLEAMASGRPVVASRIAGIPLAIDDGATGVLVAAGDSPALGAAIGVLLDAPDRRVALGRAARQRVEQDLSWQAIAARHRALYTESGAAS